MIVHLDYKYDKVKIRNRDYYITRENLNLKRINSRLRYTLLLKPNSKICYLYDCKHNRLTRIAQNVRRYKLFYNYLTDETYCFIEKYKPNKYLNSYVYKIIDSNSKAELQLITKIDFQHSDDEFLFSELKWNLNTKYLKIIIPVVDYLVRYKLKIQRSVNCKRCIDSINIEQWYNHSFLHVSNNYNDIYTVDLYNLITDEKLFELTNYNNNFCIAKHTGTIYSYVDNVLSMLDIRNNVILQHSSKVDEYTPILSLTRILI